MVVIDTLTSRIQSWQLLLSCWSKCCIVFVNDVFLTLCSVSVPSEEPAPQDMADIYLAEYLSETHGEPVSPSGRRPVTYIVYQTGDHFNLYCVFDRDGSAASDHRELLFGYECEKVDDMYFVYTVCCNNVAIFGCCTDDISLRGTRTKCISFIILRLSSLLS